MAALSTRAPENSWWRARRPPQCFRHPVSVIQYPSSVIRYPRSKQTWTALIETVTTLHTGNEATPLTRTIEEQLRSSDLPAVKKS